MRKAKIFWGIGFFAHCVFLFLLMLPNALADQYYLLELREEFGNVVSEEVFVEEINDLTMSPSGDYEARVIDPQGTVLHSQMILLESSNALIPIPYFKEGERIEIFSKEGELKAEIVVRSFARLCGNGRCEDGEERDCPFDCASSAALTSSEQISEDRDQLCGNGLCEDEEERECPFDCRKEEADSKAPIKEIVKEAPREAIKLESQPENEGNVPLSSVDMQELSFESKNEVSEKSSSFSAVSLLFALIVLLMGILGAVIYSKKRRNEQKFQKIKTYVEANMARGYSFQQIEKALKSRGITHEEMVEGMKHGREK